MPRLRNRAGGGTTDNPGEAPRPTRRTGGCGTDTPCVAFAREASEEASTTDDKVLACPACTAGITAPVARGGGVKKPKGGRVETHKGTLTIRLLVKEYASCVLSTPPNRQGLAKHQSLNAC